MSNEENDAIRGAATIGTAVLWVPAAVVGGVLYGAGKGLGEANDFGKKRGPLIGIAAAPVIVAANIIKGPFSGVKKVGDAMIGNDK